MAAPTILSETEWTAADLLERFGPIHLRRIRNDPAPGTATERDVVDIHDREGRLFELVDGVLVEKTMGLQESYLAILIARFLAEFADSHDLGVVLGADGMARLAPGLVRIPDVSFIGWNRLPGKQIPAVSMLDRGPDLAVEVLSPHNTREEMERKLVEYFDSGVRLVWYIDPRARTAWVYTAHDQSTALNPSQCLDGGTVLPGFTLSLALLFSKLPT
jgi:Uma2 family endonuclease